MPVPQVFLSSTYRDLESIRAKVAAAIGTAGMAAYGMEHFTADARRPTKETCLELAAAADVVVAIVAWRYGWIPDGEELSITELECGCAKEVLWFVIDDAAPRTGMDPDDEVAQKWPKLLAFKRRIAGQSPARFRTPEELVGKLVQALNLWRGAGADLPAPRAHSPVQAQLRGPYPGLVTFEEADEPFYFGREEEVGDALRRIESPPTGRNAWLSIEGASGAGKSSLVRAGLIPRVRREKEGEPWVVALMRPGGDPLGALARALAEAFEPGALGARALEGELRKDEGALARCIRDLFSTGGRLLLVIDQLEELFTHSRPADDRKEPELERFTALLAATLADTACPWHLVTTIRRDLIGELLRAPDLDGCRNGAQILNLPPMRRPALLQTIRAPAKKASLRFEPAHLPELIANEAADIQNALPLLAYCLHELWKDSGGVLTEDRYKSIGRVQKALLGAADSLLERLRTRPVEGVDGLATWEDAALKLLQALVAEAGTGFARRRLSHEDAIRQAGGGELGRDVFLALSGGEPKSWPGSWPTAPRLVIDSGENRPGAAPKDLPVELAHESLLSDWKPFRTHLDRNRHEIEWRDRLEKAARSWHAEGQPEETGASGWTAERYEEVAGPAPGEEVQRFLGAIRREREAREIDDRIAAILSLREEPYSLAHAYVLPHLLARTYGSLDPGDAPLAAIEALRAESAGELELVARRNVELARSPSAKDFERERARGVHLLLEALHPWLDGALDRARDRAEWVALEVASRRDELAAGWRTVLDSIAAGDAHPDYAGHPITPRYDLLPLRLRDSQEANGRVWEFLLLGTGDVPHADPRSGAWVVTRETGIVLALAPGGRFVMGADEEGDARPHEVQLGPFFISVHAFTGASPDERQVDEHGGVLPMTEIDWLQALAHSAALGGTLPTEAWWERACRAGTGTRFWSGDGEDDLERVAWYGKNSGRKVHPVGLKPANPWGLHDVHGNVWEWCRDWHGPYPDGPVEDPRGPRRGGARVMRGGAYWDGADWCRSAFRGWNHPASRNDFIGFRVAFPAAPELGTGAVGD